MISARKMKHIEITVLARDIDRVLEFLGRKAVLHLSREGEQEAGQDTEYCTETETAGVLEKIRNWASFLDVSLPSEPDEAAHLPSDKDFAYFKDIESTVEGLKEKKQACQSEIKRLQDALEEALAFKNLDAPFAQLDNLSYLTLRIGHMDLGKRDELLESLGDRAVLVPLGDDGKILAASSRKGRFTLDSELKKVDFKPMQIPEDFNGVPAELLEGLQQSLELQKTELEELDQQKLRENERLRPILGRLYSAYLMADTIAALKKSLRKTASAYSLSGWIPADMLPGFTEELERISDGRLSLRSYDPTERETVRSGKEKVPVSYRHGSFVKGFEGVVFSYGAPLYGSIDPTPFVAISFTILFGIMFGDVGQGFVLFLLGLLISKGKPAFLKSFGKYGIPLTAVGISSMLVGLLDGEVFANEHLLIRPTRAITGFITGVPMDRIIHLMPEKGSLDKLFIFFGFTIALGVVLNSIGLIINIINQFSLKRYERAIFSKTGIAGALFFWYAIFIAVRILLGGSFVLLDLIGLCLPLFLLFSGPFLWRLLTGKKPLFEHGLMVFFMEGFVELLESASSYISNTVSFLRVGAFALSHAVLSFIVFSLAQMLSEGSAAGPFFALLVMILGNAVIIILEGMIVAIQVVRLQYYEFFSKFFTDTGIEFSPFRFRRELQS